MKCPHCNVEVLGGNVCPKCKYDVRTSDGGLLHKQWLEAKEYVNIVSTNEPTENEQITNEPEQITINSNVIDDLLKLKQLLDTKGITQDEYDAMKKNIIAGTPNTKQNTVNTPNTESTTNTPQTGLKNNTTKKNNSIKGWQIACLILLLLGLLGSCGEDRSSSYVSQSAYDKFMSGKSDTMTKAERDYFNGFLEWLDDESKVNGYK